MLFQEKIMNDEQQISGCQVLGVVLGEKDVTMKVVQKGVIKLKHFITISALPHLLPPLLPFLCIH